MFLLLICTTLIALALEYFSASLYRAGYFSLASPLYLAVCLTPDDLYAFTAASLALVASAGRFLRTDYSLNIRALGALTNVLRVLAIGTIMRATKYLPIPGELAYFTIGATGFLCWMILDKILFKDTLKTPLLIAFPPLITALSIPLLDAAPSPSSLVLLAVIAIPLSNALKHPYLFLEVKDKDRLKLHLKSCEKQIESLTSSKNQLTEELANFYEMVRKLGAATLLKETVATVVNTIHRFRIPFQSCVFLLYDKDGLSPVHVESRHSAVLAISHLFQVEEPLIQEVLRTKRATLNQSSTESRRERIFQDECSALCVPLMVGKDIIGVIYLGSAKEGTHSESDLKHLKTIAALAAPSLNAAKLLAEKEQDLTSERESREAVETKNAQLTGLQQLAQRMGRSLKSLDTLSVVAKSLKEMIPAAQSVVLFRPHHRSLKAEFTHTPYSAYLQNLTLRDDEGLLGEALRKRKTILYRNTELAGMENILSSETSVVVAPLLSLENEESSQPFGLLYVGSDQPDAFTEEQRSLIETISYQTAVALKNAHLYEQTQQMALTDGLTGLYTHRLFQEKLDEEIQRASESNQQVVLAMVDADNFKTYNDTLGHPAGDALLVEIANLLREKVRASDIVCRYGGDEFALLLRNTTKAEALKTCERIREAFQLRFGGYDVQVTCSIGLACFPSDAASKKEFSKAADDALYVSKRGGRNQVSASSTLMDRATQIVAEVLAR